MRSTSFECASRHNLLLKDGPFCVFFDCSERKTQMEMMRPRSSTHILDLCPSVSPSFRRRRMFGGGNTLIITRQSFRALSPLSSALNPLPPASHVPSFDLGGALPRSLFFSSPACRFPGACLWCLQKKPWRSFSKHSSSSPPFVSFFCCVLLSSCRPRRRRSPRRRCILAARATRSRWGSWACRTSASRRSSTP
jgi:hypothetical protein